MAGVITPSTAATLYVLIKTPANALYTTSATPPTFVITKQGGAQTTISSGSVAYIANGVWSVALSSGNTDTPPRLHLSWSLSIIGVAAILPDEMLLDLSTSSVDALAATLATMTASLAALSAFQDRMAPMMRRTARFALDAEGNAPTMNRP